MAESPRRFGFGRETALHPGTLGRMNIRSTMALALCLASCGSEPPRRTMIAPPAPPPAPIPSTTERPAPIAVEAQKETFEDQARRWKEMLIRRFGWTDKNLPELKSDFD